MIIEVVLPGRSDITKELRWLLQLEFCSSCRRGKWSPSWFCLSSNYLDLCICKLLFWVLLITASLVNDTILVWKNGLIFLSPSSCETGCPVISDCLESQKVFSNSLRVSLCSEVTRSILNSLQPFLPCFVSISSSKLRRKVGQI